MEEISQLRNLVQSGFPSDGCVGVDVLVDEEDCWVLREHVLLRNIVQLTINDNHLHVIMLTDSWHELLDEIRLEEPTTEGALMFGDDDDALFVTLLNKLSEVGSDSNLNVDLSLSVLHLSHLFPWSWVASMVLVHMTQVVVHHVFTLSDHEFVDKTTLVVHDPLGKVHWTDFITGHVGESLMSVVQAILIDKTWGEGRVEVRPVVMEDSHLK